MSDKSITPIVTENYATSDTRKYKTHVLPRIEDIYKWLCEGYTDYSIAESLGICHDTLIQYKKSQTELIEVYTRARTHRNNLVMNAQFEKAKGIEKRVPKAFKIKEVEYDEFGKKVSEREKLEYGEEFVYIPPDVNAADLYLRNNSDEYKNAKADVGGLTLIQNNINLPQLQEQLKLIEEELKKLDDIEVTMVDGDDE